MKKSRILGGTLLVAGTAIGAGMIALPITSGAGGFVPSWILLTACWVYMTLTAFLFLEATLWLERDVNLVTIAEHTLGWIGKAVSWVIYLFLLYTLTTAYLSGCGAIFIHSVESAMEATLPNWIGPIPFLILFGLCIYLGTRSSDYINRALMFGLVLSYVTLGVFIAPKTQPELLRTQNWDLIWPSLSIMVTSFGFHIIIPSLSFYLGYRKDALKKTLFLGSLIPFVVYLFWEFLVLGTVPASGANSLTSLAQSTRPEVDLITTISHYVHGIDMGEVLRFFSYFAILTSFLGVSLSLHDFLADGFKIEKNAKGRFLLTSMTFIPPFFFSIFFPNIFVSALKYAALFVAILLGILPALIVWAGRYKHKFESKLKVVGGRVTLVAVILFSLFVIVVDLIDQL